MRLIDADALKELIADKLDERFRWDSKLTVCEFKTIVGDIIDKAPAVEPKQDELTEIKHRLNLLIGVLYSNQLISENDIEYIEESIKELMKGGAE